MVSQSAVKWPYRGGIDLFVRCYRNITTRSTTMDNVAQTVGLQSSHLIIFACTINVHPPFPAYLLMLNRFRPHDGGASFHRPLPYFEARRTTSSHLIGRTPCGFPYKTLGPWRNACSQPASRQESGVSLSTWCAVRPASHHFRPEQHVNFCSGASSIDTACR
jgi:hypothetical protein